MRRVPLLFVALVFVPSAASPQGMPLGPEFRVNTFTAGRQWKPSVASDAAGNLVVVWQSYGQDASGLGVYGQRYASDGTALGTEFRVNTYATSQQGNPSVADNSSGNFVVVWQSNLQDGFGYGVFGQRYASTGVPLGPEFRVNTLILNGERDPAVAEDSSGNFIVVWTSTAGPLISDVFGQRYASSGTPQGPEFQVNTFTTSFQGEPSVAAIGTSDFVVVWVSVDSALNADVFGQRYASSGTPLGPEFRVNTYTTSVQQYPSVAADATGNFVVVWQSTFQDGSYAGIFGQRYSSSGVPLGPEFQVNTYTTDYQVYPSVAADSSGNFVVAWQNGGTSYSLLPADIFGQRYASSGTPLGTEFRVNTYTTDSQRESSVASDAAGNFVVAWGSDGQDGSYAGVFGQRYSEIVPVELMRFSVE